MIRTSLDNLKTYYSYDESDVYDTLSKFNRNFEKGFHDSQSITLPESPSSYKNFLIATSGSDKHLASFAHSLTPFFLSLPFEVSCGYRLPQHTNKETFIFVLSSSHSKAEIESVISEAESKSLFSLNLTPFGYQTDPKNTVHQEYQNIPHALGFLFGLFFRFNPSFAKTQNPEKIFSLLERQVENLSRDSSEKQNPAKQLAQKHSQKAIIILSSGHLVGAAEYASGLITKWSDTFSTTFALPEAKHFIQKSFTYPTKVLSDYQVLILDSELYPNNIKQELNSIKEFFGRKRINYTLLSADTSDWLEQITESVAFLTFFSYYLSITNKVKL